MKHRQGWLGSTGVSSRGDRRPVLPSPGRRGTVLIVTMWIVLVLAGLVLVLARAMRVEATCSANDSAMLQAQAVEQGAIQYVLTSVDSLQGQAPEDANMPCEAVRIGQGTFWIIRPNYDDRAFAYGVVGESSKVNLNTAPQAMLSKLPEMSDELAASIIDWRDSDSTVTPGGAESEYYLLLSSPYQCKNAPLETVEELFLIKDMTRDVLLDEDVNRNGVLDANEDDGEDSEPSDNRDGRLGRGLLPFVTVYSAEPNTDSEGKPRVNVNDSQTQGLSDLLNKNVSADRAAMILRLARRGRPFQNVLDFYVRVGLTASEFQVIADHLTTTADAVLKGLVNVNAAPKEVLACLPGLEDADVSALLSKRAEPDADRNSLAWVAQTLTPEKATAVGGILTTRAYQFSADIVSAAGDGRAFKRCRIVVDARSSPPKVIYRQGLTHLGWPLAPELLTKLRAGAGLDEIAPARTVLQETQ